MFLYGAPSEQPRYLPKINRASPFSEGLQVCIHPVFGELVSGSRATVRGSPVYSRTQYGVAAKTIFTGGGANDFTYECKISAPADRTLAIFGSNQGSGGLVSIFAEDADSADFLALGTSSFTGSIDNNGSGSVSVTETAVPRLYGARRVGSTVTSFVNSTISTGAGTGGRDLTTSSITIGRSSSAGVNTVDAIVYLAFYWGRALTDSELGLLSRNPWQIFAPIPRRVWSLPSGGGGATVALSGIGLTAATGSTAAAISSALNGLAATSQLGSVTPSPTFAQALTGAGTTAQVGTTSAIVSKALAGASSTAQAGTPTAVITTALSGVSATAQAGTVGATQAAVQALSGISSTAQAGTTAAVVAVALSGTSATAQAGTIVPVTGTVVALSGASAAAASGSAAAQVTAGLSGQVVSAAQGTVDAAPVAAVALTGASATLAAGSVFPTLSAALSGLASAFAQGIIAPAGDKTVALSGAGISITAGTLFVQGEWLPVNDASSATWTPVSDTAPNTWTPF